MVMQLNTAWMRGLSKVHDGSIPQLTYVQPIGGARSAKQLARAAYL